MPICLTCLESNANHPINSIYLALNIQIKTLIEFCISNKLEVYQNYPNAICTCCLSTLTFIYEFKQKVLQSFEQLENGLYTQIANGKVKRESNEGKPFDADSTKDETGTNQARNNDLVHLFQSDNNLETNKNVKKKSPHKCTKCNLLFVDLDAITAHRNEIHPKVSLFVCSTCSKGFNKLKKFKKHKRTHTGQVMCEVCCKCFGSERALNAHISMHSNDNETSKLPIEKIATEINEDQVDEKVENKNRPFCNECNLSFFSLYCLKMHNNEVHRFVCETCGKVFKNLKKLQKHQRADKHTCEVCSECFCGKFALQLHAFYHNQSNKSNNEVIMSTETNQTHLNQYNNDLVTDKQLNCVQDGDKVGNKIKCKKCNLSFINQSSLMAHQNLKYPIFCLYRCPTCSKCFKNLRKFETHLITHTDEFQCEVCSKRFGDELALQHHSISLHCSDNESFKCNLPIEGVRIASEVSANYKTGASRFDLIQCKYDLQSNSQLNGDQVNEIVERKEGYICTKCNLSFINWRSIRAHKNEIHQRVWRFVCSTCGQGFNKFFKFKNHERKHTGEFRCEVCSKCFGDKVGLENHVLLHCEVNPSFISEFCPTSCTQRSEDN